MLTETMTFRETLGALSSVQQERISRFWFKSPCYFVRTVDIAIHVALPELIEGVLPKSARWLRLESPRWGRSWRGW